MVTGDDSKMQVIAITCGLGTSKELWQLELSVALLALLVFIPFSSPGSGLSLTSLSASKFNISCKYI